MADAPPAGPAYRTLGAPHLSPAEAVSPRAAEQPHKKKLQLIFHLQAGLSGQKFEMTRDLYGQVLDRM
jgi:hypothetical protein